MQIKLTLYAVQQHNAYAHSPAFFETANCALTSAVHVLERMQITRRELGKLLFTSIHDVVQHLQHAWYQHSHAKRTMVLWHHQGSHALVKRTWPYSEAECCCHPACPRKEVAVNAAIQALQNLDQICHALAE